MHVRTEETVLDGRQRGYCDVIPVVHLGRQPLHYVDRIKRLCGISP